MANTIGVSHRYYQSLEKGSSAPSLDTLQKILAGLEMTYEQFFDHETIPATTSVIIPVSIHELEQIVARASKRDNAINLELERTKRELAEFKEIVPPEIRDNWKKAPGEVKAICLFAITREKEYLKLFPAAKVLKFLNALRTLGLGLPKVVR